MGFVRECCETKLNIAFPLWIGRESSFVCEKSLGNLLFLSCDTYAYFAVSAHAFYTIVRETLLSFLFRVTLFYSHS